MVAKKFQLTGLFCSCILILCWTASACFSQEVLAEITDASHEAIRFEGFRLDRDQEIQIDAVGFRPKRSGHLYTHAWILDTVTRSIVWDLEDASTDRRTRELVDFRDRIRLSKGTYEVYFSTFPFQGLRRDGWGNLWERIFTDWFDERDRTNMEDAKRRELKDLRLVVRGHGRRYRENNIDELREGFFENAIVSWTRVRDDERLQQGFTLERPMDLQVYALGEVRKEEAFDYGWIVDLKSRAKVWKMTHHNSQHAGGAQKNRVVNEVIHLPEGQYLASFVTDDSHSYDRWNQAPPMDPTFWGMTIRAATPSSRKFAKTFDYQDRRDEHVILDLTRLRNNEFRTKGFTLNRDLDLHIYAIGEGWKNEMFDYGWIVDSKNRNRVWAMDFRSTENAGGADKNRVFDRVVPFKKGSYLAYFVTDGSHSYLDWNSAAPHDRERWGITIACPDGRFDPRDVSSYEPEKDQSILVQLTRLGNHERERDRFILDKDAQVRIYAIGEGTDGRMYDYGWIENADTRTVVWEMTYRMTEHAGGDMKNRMVDQVLSLRKGEYIVYFETDDSHSAEDWNSAPPVDPVNWGITVYHFEK